MAALAATLTLALALASPGAPLARPHVETSTDNVARARRGLLPRKAARARPASHARRLVVPQAPTWLGEPGDVTEPEVAAEAAGEVVPDPVAPSGAETVAAVLPASIDPEPVAVAPAVAPSPELLAAVIAAPLPAPAPIAAATPRPPPSQATAAGPGLRVALAGAHVELFVLRRLAAREPARAAMIRAVLTGPEVETVIVRPER